LAPVQTRPAKAGRRIAQVEVGPDPHNGVIVLPEIAGRQVA